jgi:hypothetical protein
MRPDLERFGDPDKFNLMRSAQCPISFSFEAHCCLDQAVARVNIRESLFACLCRAATTKLLSRLAKVPFGVEEQITDLQVGITRPN